MLRQVFAWTAVPGLLSVLVLLAFLREGRRDRAARPGATAPEPGGSRWRTARRLGGPFWLFTGLATLFALGNSSDAFLFLRTISLDSWLEGVPLAFFGYNVVYALLATPLGVLSDRHGRLPVLLAGYVAFALVYAGWAVANSGWQTWLLFGVYGVYAAGTDGVARALVVDLVPDARRGTALGAFHGLTGFAALPANLLAGWVWGLYGPGSTFALGAGLAGLAACGLLFGRRWLAGGRASGARGAS